MANGLYDTPRSYFRERRWFPKKMNSFFRAVSYGSLPSEKEEEYVSE
jgi:hypothetical protein